MVHKPKHKVYSFKGLISNGGQDEINLERQNVNLAYRIVKFQGIAKTPGAGAAGAHVLKVYRESQSSIDAVINFSTDTDLLAVVYYNANVAAGDNDSTIIVFDNILFSRNIFVTQSDTLGTSACNYYVELEEVPVGAATLMQLKLGVARKLNLRQD